MFWWKVREEECAFEMGNAKAGRQAKQSKRARASEGEDSKQSVDMHDDEDDGWMD